MKVYILSDYHEEGAENVVATLDKEKLPEMLGGLVYGDDSGQRERLAVLLEDDERKAHRPL